MKITTVGIDLGKTVFHLVGMDDRGAILLKKRVSRSQMVTLLANTPACVVGMEASCGAHHLGRELTALGHDVRLIPAQFVKPFVKSQKNDYVDAEAIAEAVQRPTMRFVPVKTADQLDLQAVHRVRDRLIERRTGAINQLRAFLLERGMVIRTGRKYLQETLPAVLAEAEEKMSPRLSRLLAVLVKEWKQLEEEIAQMDAEIGEIAKQDPSCQRLLTVPGVGPLVATALVAAVGNGAAFSKGREFAAWLGLVPRQCSTGGNTTGSAMAQLSFIKNGQTYVCSGTLVNPKLTDASLAPKPLLLTADHCISDNTTARTVIAVQNDWYSSCGGSERAPTYQVRAQQLLAHTPVSNGDHSLILLGDFPAGSTWYLSGWSTVDFSVGASVAGLHHPHGLPLKISYGNRIADSSTNVTDLGTAPALEYYRVNWTTGASGSGSSGSGLFESGVLRGTLTYGNGQVDGGQCGSLAGYGRLRSGYSSLQPWFETGSGGEIISRVSAPVPSATLTGTQATFTWNASPDATEYVLYVGSSAGSYNLAYKNTGLSTSTPITGLPANGSTIYVRLFTHLSIGWYSFDYTYNAVTSGTGAPILTSVFPTGLPASSAQSTISLSGSGYVQGSVVSFGLAGVPPTSLATTYISATSLQATVPATLLSAAGTAQIYVINPTGTSAPLNFTIVAPAGSNYTSSSYIPHFAAGGPLISGFNVVNNSAAAGQFQFAFYDDSGKLLPVPVSGFGTVSQFADSVPANGVKYYEAGTNSTALYSGSAQFRSTNSLITVQELFRNHAPDNNYYEASIPSTAGGFGFIVPFDATKFGETQIYTGFAIANLDGSNPARVTCLVRDATGILLPNALTVPLLGPLGHWAEYRFPALNGLRGTFDCSSTTKIAPVALRFLGTNSLSTLPITLK